MSVQLHPDVTATSTEDGAVLLNERTGRYWQLNTTGAHVLWSLLDEQQPEQIAGELATRYGVERQRIAEDVLSALSQLQSNSLVQRT